MNVNLSNIPPKAGHTDQNAVQYAADNSLRLHPAQAELIDLTKSLPWGGMMGDRCELQFFQLLLRAINAKKYLEIGTYTGCSAMAAALALPPDGKVVTLELYECHVDIGRPFWEKAGVDQKIETRIGPAKETLDALIAEGQAGTFDFVFIDADKDDCDVYYEKSLQLARKNGIIAIDNVFWMGYVYGTIDDPYFEKGTVALRALNRKLHRDDRIHLCMLTLADGVTLALKK
ncbi:putative caffeoyl-CoA O-methyltransferase 1 [Ixodes scapularis]